MAGRTGEYLGGEWSPLSFEHDRAHDLDLQIIEWEQAQQERIALTQEPEGEQL